MEERWRRRREAKLITFPADFTWWREVKITALRAHCSRPPLLPPLLPAFWRKAWGACFAPSAHWAIEGSDGWLHKEARSIFHSQAFSFLERLFHFPFITPSPCSYSVWSVITVLTFFSSGPVSFSFFLSLIHPSFLCMKECFPVHHIPSAVLVLGTDVEAFFSQHSLGRVGTGLNTLLVKGGGKGKTPGQFVVQRVM